MDDYNSSRRELTAFFDDHASASRAQSALLNAGVAASDIRLVAGKATETTADTHENKSFFEMLGDFFMPDDDRSVYAEGLNRGGYMIVVTTSGQMVDVALDILDDEGAVDMDARTQEWESSGWTSRDAGYADAGLGIGHGTTSSEAGVSGRQFGDDRRYDDDGRTLGDSIAGGIASAGAAMGMDRSRHADDGRTFGDSVAGGIASARDAMGMDDRRHADDEGTISRVEERLAIGKRDVSNGRLRVRAYVVEEPVSENVALRSERVEIDRRPVDRPATDADALFQDRTIEVDAHSEEAVVSKTARVVEEIDVRKVAEDRTETVSDTLRRTEVEIEDDRDDMTR